MSGAPALLWLRQDLRLSDNPALAAGGGFAVVAARLAADYSPGAHGGGVGPPGGGIGRLGRFFWNRRYEPAAMARDRELESKLRESGLDARIFTAFWRACVSKSVALPSKDAPRRLPSPEDWPHSPNLPELSLEPAVDWAGGFREV